MDLLALLLVVLVAVGVLAGVVMVLVVYWKWLLGLCLFFG